LEIVWNTTSNNGISQMTTAALLVTIALPLNDRVFGQRFSWRHRGPLTPYLHHAIVGVAEDARPPTRCDWLGRVMIVLFALYAA
jgi:hypothetical protein